MKCANCGRQIESAEYRNIDGEPCCKGCYELEEEKLKHY